MEISTRESGADAVGLGQSEGARRCAGAHPRLWVKAVIGVLVAAITLPIAFLLSFFGLSFKGSDVVMEAAEREATLIGERMQASEAYFTSPPEGLHDHGFDEATETKATCTPRAGLGWGKAQAHKVVHGALDRVGLEEPEQLPPPRVV